MPRPAYRTTVARRSGSRGRFGAGVAILAAAGLAGLAVANQRRARRAEHDNPPRGSFVEVDGLRVHYVDRGHGEPVVLVHGNGTSLEDFECGGLVDIAAARHRVIAFDRPGFGHTERPRSTLWTQHAQADLIVAAMARIGVVRATVLGHSWGCSVALAMAERHPRAVKALVLVSGYYFPSVRSDVLTGSPPALPVVGDLMRYTISPTLSRLMWPVPLAKMFGPESVPAKFDGFPREMAFRPSQIRASAIDTALMIPDAVEASPRYGEITTPTVIIAGGDDRIVDFEAQSARLHGTLRNSVLRRIPMGGHMIHQTSTAAVAAAIDEASDLHLHLPAGNASSA
jgi:pimeloyl-ACP methyl ester carboxylesterase